MRAIILSLVTALLISACSPGGSTTSTGATGITGFTSGTTGLTLFATVTSTDFSIDTSGITCTIDPLVDPITFDQFVTTSSGTFSVTINDTSAIPTNSDRGVLFTDYTVSWAGISPGAPFLSSRTFSTTFSVLLNGTSNATGSAAIIIADIDSTKPEFTSLNPAGFAFTYSVVVTYRGSRIDTGEAVSVSASTTVELANFCPADAMPAAT